MTIEPTLSHVNPPRLAFLDALRGWAILLVIAVHASIAFQPGTEFLHRLAWHGRMGVVLFFVVSAVALTIAYEQHASEDSPTLNFFIRRFFRIAPMFYVGILIALAIDGFSPRVDAPQGIEAHHVLLTALFLHGWWPDTIDTVVPGGWSIAAETSFYLCFPLAIHFLRNRARLLFALTGSLLLAYFLNSVSADYFYSQFDRSLAPTVRAFFYTWFPNHLPVFLIGMFIAGSLKSPRGEPRKAESIALCLLAMTLLYSLLYIQPIQGVLGSNHLFGAAFALLALALAAWEIPLLVNGVIRHIGKISFSMYIVHSPLMRLFEKRIIPMPLYPNDPDLRFVLHFLLLVVTSVALSTVTYRLIERPGIDFATRLIQRKQGQERSSS